jgi:hypothetical protein
MPSYAVVRILQNKLPSPKLVADGVDCFKVAAGCCSIGYMQVRQKQLQIENFGTAGRTENLIGTEPILAQLKGVGMSYSSQKMAMRNSCTNRCETYHFCLLPTGKKFKAVCEIFPIVVYITDSSDEIHQHAFSV